MENELNIASGWTRFGNYILDFMCYYIFLIAIIFFTGSFLGSKEVENFNFIDFVTVSSRNPLVLASGYFFYYFISEVLFGTTIGKQVTDTKIVTRKGDVPKVKNLIGRTFARFIPFDNLSFLSGSGIGWHDYVSRTRIVLKYPPKEKAHHHF